MVFLIIAKSPFVVDVKCVTDTCRLLDTGYHDDVQVIALLPTNEHAYMTDFLVGRQNEKRSG